MYIPSFFRPSEKTPIFPSFSPTPRVHTLLSVIATGHFTLKPCAGPAPRPPPSRHSSFAFHFPHFLPLLFAHPLLLQFDLLSPFFPWDHFCSFFFRRDQRIHPTLPQAIAAHVFLFSFLYSGMSGCTPFHFFFVLVLPPSL